MPRLSEAERMRAIGMVDAGQNYSAVARFFNCSQPTIRNLIQRYQQTGSANDRPRPGAERVTTPAQDRYIVLSHLRDRLRTASRTAREIPGRHNPRISSDTVLHRLRAHNLRARRPVRGNLLTPIRRRNRHTWCQRHRRCTQRQWNGVLFSDESRFCVDGSDGRDRVWRRRGERYADCCIRQSDRWGGQSVMMWAGISFRHRTPLVVIGGNLNAAWMKYCKLTLCRSSRITPI